MLQGLVKAGYKETIKNIARKAGYKPESAGVLRGARLEAEAGVRRTPRGRPVGALKLQKRERFDGVSEAEICEAIVEQKLSYKDVVGRLPKDVGLTPAIMVALLPSLSDRDLRMLTPTLEELGLMAEPEIRARWEKAIAEATDQRALNIAKNVRSKELKEKLEEASRQRGARRPSPRRPPSSRRRCDVPHRQVRLDGGRDRQVEGGAVADPRGLPRRASCTSQRFDTMGTVLKPKAPSRAAVQHMLAGHQGGGRHGARVGACARSTRAGVRVARGSKLVVIVVGDEAGEDGAQLARAFGECGYQAAAMAVLVNVAGARGRTVQDCARSLVVPFSEVNIDQFDDPYQVPRVLRALLEAPKLGGAAAGAGARSRGSSASSQLPSCSSPRREHSRSVWTTRSFSARRSTSYWPTSAARMCSARTDACASKRRWGNGPHRASIASR